MTYTRPHKPAPHSQMRARKRSRANSSQVLDDELAAKVWLRCASASETACCVCGTPGYLPDQSPWASAIKLFVASCDDEDHAVCARCASAHTTCPYPYEHCTGTFDDTPRALHLPWRASLKCPSCPHTFDTTLDKTSDVETCTRCNVRVCVKCVRPKQTCCCSSQKESPWIRWAFRDQHHRLTLKLKTPVVDDADTVDTIATSPTPPPDADWSDHGVVCPQCTAVVDRVSACNELKHCDTAVCSHCGSIALPWETKLPEDHWKTCPRFWSHPEYTRRAPDEILRWRHTVRLATVCEQLD